MNKNNKLKIIFGSIVSIVLIWAGLTKVGLIPNFLDIEALYSGAPDSIEEKCKLKGLSAVRICKPHPFNDKKVCHWDCEKDNQDDKNNKINNNAKKKENYNIKIKTKKECIEKGMEVFEYVGCDTESMEKGLCVQWECIEKQDYNHEIIDEKPVIYLYPQNPQNIKVKLDYDGKIIADYPRYDKKIKGWEVKAYPDGTIINKEDGQEYSYLFWEGKASKKIDWDLSKGFIVKGENSKDFLQKILPKLGLTPKEYNEFIVYWYPILQKNKYNLIHFAGEKYTNQAKLSTVPKADSVLRVFMVYKPLEKEIKIEEQKFEKFERKGFVVVEWGGTIVR